MESAKRGSSGPDADHASFRSPRAEPPIYFTNTSTLNARNVEHPGNPIDTRRVGDGGGARFEEGWRQGEQQAPPALAGVHDDAQQHAAPLRTGDS